MNEKTTPTSGEEEINTAMNASEAEFIEMFSTKRMISNSLKLMNGKFGGGFYIKFVQDYVKKVGWLMLILVYPDDSYKAITLYKNALSETEIGGECMAEEQPLKKGVKEAPKVSWDGKSQPPIFNDFIGIPLRHCDIQGILKYSSPDMPIPVSALWKLIMDNYRRIPKEYVYETGSNEAIYREMEYRSKEASEQEGFEFMFEESRFYVPSKCFNDVILEHGRKVSEVRSEFNVAGAFIRNDDKSYQLPKKLGGELVRYYVFNRKSKKEVKEPESLESLEYQTEVQTSGEKMESELRREIEDLRQRVRVQLFSDSKEAELRKEIEDLKMEIEHINRTNESVTTL